MPVKGIILALLIAVLVGVFAGDEIVNFIKYIINKGDEK